MRASTKKYLSKRYSHCHLQNMYVYSYERLYRYVWSDLCLRRLAYAQSCSIVQPHYHNLIENPTTTDWVCNKKWNRYYHTVSYTRFMNRTASCISVSFIIEQKKQCFTVVCSFGKHMPSQKCFWNIISIVPHNLASNSTSSRSGRCFLIISVSAPRGCVFERERYGNSSHPRRVFHGHVFPR